MRMEDANATNIMSSERKSKNARTNTCQKKFVATIVSSRDVQISRRKEGTTMSSRGEELVHEIQNHEDFEVKGEGRQRHRLGHVDGDFPSCMRKTKKNNIQKTTSECG